VNRDRFIGHIPSEELRPHEERPIIESFADDFRAQRLSAACRTNSTSCAT